MDLEYYLIYLAIILLIGTLCSVLAYKINVSNVFFLILAGMIFGSFGMIELPESAIITISTIALILVVFDSTNKFTFKEFYSYSIPAIKLSIIFFFAVAILLTIFTQYIFSINLLLSLLISCIVYGIDPMITMSSLKGKSDLVSILKIEAIINTPITIVSAFLLLEFVQKQAFNLNEISYHLIPFFQQIIMGIGVGTIIGFFIVLIMKHNFMGDLSHLTLITSAIITYVIAEVLEGNGIIAITAFGLVFGNTKMHHKLELENFASIFTYTLEILVYILMGTFLVINKEYIFRGTLLFLIYLIIRLVSVWLCMPKSNFIQKLFMTSNVPKGVDVAVIILLLISQFKSIPGIDAVINLCLLFILYSIVLSTFIGTFIGEKIEGKSDILHKHHSKALKNLVLKKNWKS